MEDGRHDDRIRGLLDLARIVRGGAALPEKLAGIAEAAGRSLKFRSVALSLYRPAWDDFELVALHGHDPGAGGEAATVELLASDGRTLGLISVDRLPSPDELDLLEAYGAHAAQAIESAEEAAGVERRRAGLAHMLAVSSELAGTESVESVLQAVCHAARDALGFELAVVELVDRATDRYRPVAAAGIDLAHADIQLDVPAAALEAIFEPRFERDGCYLLGRDEALALVHAEPSSYRSSQNGLGPGAWDRHWLVAPWWAQDGTVAGFIWVDDPTDRLIPDRSQLQSLRLLANQVAAALEAASRYEALRSAEELHGTMLAASPAGILFLGTDGRVRDWNDAARRMFGYADDDVIGSEPPWIAADDLEGYRERFAEHVQSDEVRVHVFRDRRADGDDIDVRTSSAPVRDLAGTPRGVVAVIEDITEQVRAAADLERRNSELEALHTTTLNLLDRLDVGSTLEQIVAQAGELLGTKHGYVYIVDDAADEVVVAIGCGLFEAYAGSRLKRGEGVGGRVWDTGETLSVADYRTWPGHARQYEGIGMRAITGVPLHSGGAVVGVLGVAYEEDGRQFTEPEIRLLHRFARLASLALTNARLYDDLRASQELYRTVAVSSRDMILLLSLDGRVQYVSPSQRELLGYDEDELIGVSALDLIHPEDVEAVANVVGASVAGEPSRPQAARVRHRDGHWVHVEGLSAPILGDDGGPTGILGVVRDITERMRIEDARREAQASLVREKEHTERLLQSANAIVIGLDREGKIGVFNDEAEQVTGYTREEVAGMSSWEVLTPRSRFPEVASMFDGWMRGEPLRQVNENPIVTKSGAERMISWRNALVYSADGAIEGLISFGIDLTERRHLEEQLRQSQKMEAIGKLAGGIAHDFNNLLTAITGYGDLALARLAADDPVRRNVEEMRRAGERAAGLTRQLLAYSRKQVLQPKVLRLNEVVDGIESMLARLLGERIELSTRLDPALGWTRADPGQIEQVLMNLAINARDAMPDGGRLTITTANVELDERFARQHVGTAPGDYVVLSVGDTGTGIDSETLERIFDPFFTTKPQGQGTGLGLSTVYGIVKQTGGQILVYSEPGRGTAFKVYLPRTWEHAAGRTEARAARGPRAGGGTETVLLVEDEDVVRTLVREMLEADGYNVLAAQRGLDALDVARSHSGPIDLLMTDVVMPGLSGQQLAEDLLAERPGTRVVFTSGYTEDAIAGHGVLRPGTAFLEKPFSDAELARTLRGLLDAERAA